MVVLNGATRSQMEDGKIQGTLATFLMVVPNATSVEDLSAPPRQPLRQRQQQRYVVNLAVLAILAVTVTWLVMKSRRAMKTAILKHAFLRRTIVAIQMIDSATHHVSQISQQYKV